MNLRFVAAVAMASIALAGCLSSGTDETAPVEPIANMPYQNAMNIALANTIVSSEHTVDAAVKFSNDLYEPTMEVSDTGAIYVTGHTILVDTTGAPAFVSHDDGESWQQMAFSGELVMPGPLHGATPPPSDEIFIVSGDDGYAYGVDITLATFPINAWANDGTEHVYHNPNAYDREESSTAGTCSAFSLNDRPWAATANGKLLLVNNPGGGPMQIGVMDVPMDLPAGASGPVGPEWNTCASSGGFIPGIPDIRDDHMFAVPQIQNGKLHVVVGNATDIYTTEQLHVTDVDDASPGTTNYGHAVFDEAGTMFVGVRNNDDSDDKGRFTIAVSTDMGHNFTLRHFDFDEEINSIYLDGNMAGEGALMTWGSRVDGGTNWYAGHLFLGNDGGAVLQDVSMMLEQGPNPSAHVQGAGAGPDGRAYLVMDYGGAPGSMPLTVVRQDSGPTLPVTVVAATE